MSYYILPVLLLAAFGVYYVLVIPKMKENSQNALHQLKQTFAGKEKEFRERDLNDPRYFKLIKDAVGTEDIQGIAHYFIKRTAKDERTKKMLNTISSGINKTVGTQLKTQEDFYYLALTEKALYYLTFKDGALNEKKRFDLLKITHLNLGKAELQDVVLKRMDSSYQKLSFEHENKPETFFFMQTLFMVPKGEIVLEKSAEWTILFVEPFVEKLKERTPLFE